MNRSRILLPAVAALLVLAAGFAVSADARSDGAVLVETVAAGAASSFDALPPVEIPDLGALVKPEPVPEVVVETPLAPQPSPASETVAAPIPAPAVVEAVPAPEEPAPVIVEGWGNPQGQPVYDGSTPEPTTAVAGAVRCTDDLGYPFVTDAASLHPDVLATCEPIEPVATEEES